MVRIAGDHATRGGQISAWSKGSNYSTLFAATAKIDGTPALYLSFGGYDDYRGDTFVSPATRDAIFAARLAADAKPLEYYREWLAKYGGCVGHEYARWVVDRAEQGRQEVA